MICHPSLYAAGARTAALAMLTLAAGCASRAPFTDKSINAEHAAFARCAVHQAFVAPDSDQPAVEVAQSAVGRCDREKARVRSRLAAENAGKPGADSFVAGYIDEMHTTMVREIAAQMPRIRALRKAMEKSRQLEEDTGGTRI